jgi:hypothetical protein
MTDDAASPSRLIRQRLAATQKSAHNVERQRLEAIARRVRQDLKANPAERITLWPTDAAVLVRAAERDIRSPTPKGAPPTSAGFHVWIAAHYLWGQSQTPKGTLDDVAEAWSLSPQAVDKIMKRHRAQARALLAEFGEDAGIESLINEWIDVFRALRGA